MSQKLNKTKTRHWYSSIPYAYGWYIACYIVHIYRLSGSIGAYHCIGMVKKSSFWFVDRGFRPQYTLLKILDLTVGALLTFLYEKTKREATLKALYYYSILLQSGAFLIFSSVRYISHIELCLSIEPLVQ